MEEAKQEINLEELSLRHGIPAPILEKTGGTVPIVHRIKSGETLADVAKEYKVAKKRIVALNGLDEFHIPVGLTIYIPQ